MSTFIATFTMVRWVLPLSNEDSSAGVRRAKRRQNVQHSYAVLASERIFVCTV